ncbi:MAG TPA: YtxH domain-containing protein, partial [Ktedonobacteraceae bacterium]
MKDSNKSLLWGALIGSVVGSVTALLLAPKSGRELRQDISEGARQVSEKSQELASKVGEQSAQIVS